MDVSETQFPPLESMPIRHTKHQGVFGKYAASMAALEDSWSAGADGRFHGIAPLTPVTPHLSLPLGPESFNPAFSMDPIKKEEDDLFFSPASLEGTISPDDLLAADNSPLLDNIDAGEMQNWESLFLEGAADQPTEQQSAAEPSPAAPQDTLVTDDLLQLPAEQAMQDDLSLFPEGKAALDFELASLISSQSRGTERGRAQQQTSPRMGSSPLVGSVAKARSPATSDKTKKKVDDLGITVYKRKPRSTPLMPVEVPEDGDGTAAKRAKNTEAARRSRARKLERMSQLEERVRELLDENEKLRAELAQYKGA